jgi:hypothetical protein
MNYTLKTISRIEAHILDAEDNKVALAFLYRGEGWRVHDAGTAADICRCRWKRQVLLTYRAAMLKARGVRK